MAWPYQRVAYYFNLQMFALCLHDYFRTWYIPLPSLDQIECLYLCLCVIDSGQERRHSLVALQTHVCTAQMLAASGLQVRGCSGSPAVVGQFGAGPGRKRMSSGSWGAGRLRLHWGAVWEFIENTSIYTPLTAEDPAIEAQDMRKTRTPAPAPADQGRPLGWGGRGSGRSGRGGRKVGRPRTSRNHVHCPAAAEQLQSTQPRARKVAGRHGGMVRLGAAGARLPGGGQRHTF